MIERLQNSDLEVSKNIQSVFQSSYKVETNLLNVNNFPPLQKPLKNYINSKTDFFGFLKDGNLAGVIEFEHNNSLTVINSLVVNPNFFRQGIAKIIEIYF